MSIEVSHDYQAFVTRRAAEIRRFLDWANAREASGPSLRWSARHDIEFAATASSWFPERWWGLVVFTCFGALKGTEMVKDALSRPASAAEAERVLSSISFAQGAIGHHRIQATHKGAKEALVAACQHADTFRDILLNREDDFDGRFKRLQTIRARQWGRTTCFDLLLRAAALGISDRRYWPERAYLAGSTGPSSGFKEVWGVAVVAQTAAWCEQVLAWWSDNWKGVAASVDVTWQGEPYIPADFENALCIYQEHLARGWVGSAPQRRAICDTRTDRDRHNGSNC